MRIIKRISNNAALALDGAGNELAVLGKGIGFPSIPYELTDLEKIDRTFYNIDPRYMDMIASLPQSILLASADLVEQAEINLDCELNPNLPFTLADHLQFAIERINKGIDLATPLAYDVQHLYPLEYELGLLALDILQDYTGNRLPDSEAVNVALHLINAEAETGDQTEAALTLKVIAEVDDIVERELHFKLDKQSFHYSRFASHLRYLIQRLEAGKPDERDSGGMLRMLAREYPKIYLCARRVAEHLEKTHQWHCNDEETLYLMLHINRVQEKSE